MLKQQSIPTLYGTLAPDGRIKVFCEYCGFHYHGKGNNVKPAGCWNPRSPYLKTGYYVKIKI